MYENNPEQNARDRMAMADDLNRSENEQRRKYNASPEGQRKAQEDWDNSLIGLCFKGVGKIAGGLFNVIFRKK